MKHGGALRNVSTHACEEFHSALCVSAVNLLGFGPIAGYSLSTKLEPAGFQDLYLQTPSVKKFQGLYWQTLSAKEIA